MDHTYDDFIATEGIPVVHTFAVADLFGMAVEPWERIGGEGSYVLLEGRGLADARITEIPPGKELKEQRHLFEESVFVVEGSGRTELWNDSGFRTAFNWERGAVFAIPLNVHFVHTNRNQSAKVRLLSITNAPLMLNLFHDPDYIFNCDRDFPDRFGPGVTDYSKPAVSPGSELNRFGVPHGLPFEGDLVPSAYDAPLPPAPYRGADGGLFSLELGHSSIGSHISEFPGKTYKKAHRHGAGAHVVLLSGTGYSLLWKADEEPIRVDWKPGCVIVPPENVYHQHFNTGDVPARYLALRFSGRRSPLPDRDDNQSQIEYEDESPKIRETFRASAGL